MPKKILVVEDNDQNRLLMADVLRPFGYEMLEAKDGEEGVRMAKEHKPDLIFMDLHMPVMDGLTATSLLKSDPETKHIKIIAVTSFAMKGDMEKILAAGCADYIAKPVNTRQLPEIVMKILGE
jgi:two-component system cell cycle response regulator DivK